MDEAFLDLQKAMNPFAQNKDITELKITQHDANLSPVVLVGMSHQSITDMAELRKIAESYIRNEAFCKSRKASSISFVQVYSTVIRAVPALITEET